MGRASFRRRAHAYDRHRVYYATAGEQVRMDARHCMRDVGTIEDDVTSAKMSARQRGAIGETLDDKRYSIKQVAHDTIMDQLEPGAIPLDPSHGST